MSSISRGARHTCVCVYAGAGVFMYARVWACKNMKGGGGRGELHMH
jgi:hypothetical protein